MPKVMFSFRIAVCLLLPLLSANLAAAAGPDCLEYEPAVVQLTGKAVKEVRPGPPNFDSVEKGDQQCIYWFLHLDRPVCVQGKAGGEYPPVTGIRQIQLVLNAAQYQAYAPLVSRRVAVAGKLFGAQTAHHYTPVLLYQIDSMKPAD